jgi:hypothetical protein
MVLHSCRQLCSTFHPVGQCPRSSLAESSWAVLMVSHDCILWHDQMVIRRAGTSVIYIVSLDADTLREHSTGALSKRLSGVGIEAKEL